ncbi:hypothetical protein [Halomonas denitrificans]|uniref:hypothetical protein n=1 Tax=Halomonas denitrificans TaxID=370769 RepID=UPI001300860C|nr:hypothetical protein [Halomonas denitrificans]
MATPETQVIVKTQAGKQSKARSYCISSADVAGTEISGAERLKALKKHHKKAIETVRCHRKALGII